MKVPIYQVDAFASELFKGNPAAVCPLFDWLPDELMQSIAAENNLAETAFVVKEENGMRIRWFTPEVEVKLCGHATLATAHVLFNEEKIGFDQIAFNSLSGPLVVSRDKDMITLDFPADPPAVVEDDMGLLEALGVFQGVLLKGETDFMVVLRNEEAVAALKPDFRKLKEIGARGVICTSTGKEVDFVSRFFAPGVGIDEDPVTGSAHTTLTPYWAGVLGKTHMKARQISKRGGELDVALIEDRVTLSGKAITYLRGEIEI